MKKFNNQELEIVKYIKEYLPFREKHILSARELSIEIAEKYNIDTQKASIAALCHDLGKR